MSQHTDTARRHIEAAGAARSHLEELYANPPSQTNGAGIAATHQSIGHGLKLAEIHAELAQAEALEEIAAALRPRQTEITLETGAGR